MVQSDELDPGSAGVPPAPRWHSRGYLPHFEGKQVPQLVTFRLADSMPREILEKWRVQLSHLPDAEASIERRKRIEEWLDQGAGECWLRDPRIGSMVEQALLQFDGQRYHLHAWVVMPNHVHVLLTLRDAWSLSSVLHTWKSFTSKKANQILERRGKFWQEEYFDRYIRDGEHFRRAARYTELNPVTAGLCKHNHEWQLGSARMAGGTPALPGHNLADTIVR